MGRFLTALFIFFVVRADAFELAPEFQHFGERELESLDDPGRIDSEYSSDVLTYSLPFSWRSAWLHASQGYQISLGSLDGRRFLVENRLKAQTALNDKVTFQLQYLEQSEFENEFRHLVLEFGYRMAPRWTLSIYGEPSSRKSEDDAGVALTYAFAPEHRLRFFHTWIDFSLNQRNESSDFYSEKPTAFGAVGRKTDAASGAFLEYAFRIEPESRRIFPAEKEYSHENRYFHVLIRQPFADGYWNWGYSAEDKREAEADLVSADLSERVHLKKSIVHAQYETREWLFGLQSIHRSWFLSDGKVVHRDLLPHLWYDLGAGRDSSWNIGYEFTWHRGEGPSELEHRLNLAYRWSFPTGAVKLLFTADLDEFGGGKTWEGGSGQLQLFF